MRIEFYAEVTRNPTFSPNKHSMWPFRQLRRKRILRAATNHGVETIEIICLPNNVGMRMLAQKFKTHFTFEESALTGRLLALRPTPFSLMREVAGDAVDFGVALFGPAGGSRERTQLGQCARASPLIDLAGNEMALPIES